MLMKSQTLGLLASFIILAVFAGCSACSDERDDAERQLIEMVEEESRALEAFRTLDNNDHQSDNSESNDRTPTIQLPCNSKTEGYTILVNGIDYICSNDKWAIKD